MSIPDKPAPMITTSLYNVFRLYIAGLLCDIQTMRILAGWAGWLWELHKDYPKDLSISLVSSARKGKKKEINRNNLINNVLPKEPATEPHIGAAGYKG